MATASYLKCFNSREVESTNFGDRLVGDGVDVYWFEESPGLAYYSFVNLVLMLFLLLLGFWKRESVELSFKRFMLMVWQTSVLLVAISVTIAGITRLTLFWAVLHSCSEFVMIYSIILTEKKVSKAFTIAFFVIGGLYFLTDMILALASPLQSAYSIVAGMGAPIDATTFIGWIVLYHRKRVKIAPMLAFLLHSVYIVLLFMNCFIKPWGRVSGLIINTVALFFASMPANRNSWRFVEFMHTCLKDDSQLAKSPTQMNKPAESTPEDSEEERTEEMPEF